MSTCCGSGSVTTASGSDLHTTVREKYAAAARASSSGSCCASDEPFGSRLYDPDETQGLPDTAVQASLGCGNPTLLAELHPGEVVLDLGSGGGLDVLLSARRVGAGGYAYGLDMTDEMLELARKNAAEAGATNVEFLKGHIEAVPLPDSSVDVIISNCVINLAPDKDAVLREAYRVLRPGGRLAVSDVVARGELPEEVKRSLEAWAGCVAGALHEAEYLAKLEDAGFTGAELQVTRTYSASELEGICCTTGPEDGSLVSAFIRARKPAPAD